MFTLLVLFVFLYPFLIWPWAGENYYLVKSIYLILSIGVMWAAFLWSIGCGRRLGELRFGIVEVCLLLFGGLLTASVVVSVDVVQSVTGVGVRYEGLWAWFCYLSLFWFGYCFCSNYKVLVGSFVISGWLGSVYGILQYLGLDFVPRAPYQHWVRSFGFFENSNYFGTYLVLVILAGLGLALSSRSWYIRAMWLVMVATALAAVGFSGTRGAWVGVCVGMIFFAWLVRTDWKTVGAVIGFGGALSVLVYLDQGRNLPRLYSMFEQPLLVLSGDGSAGSGRLYIWQQALPLVRDYVWLGSGLDTFGIVFPGEKFFHNAHNQYLQLAITAGIPAMTAYVVGLLTVLGKGVVALSRGRDFSSDKVMLAGLLAACLGYMVQTSFNISVISVAPFFWMLLGICYRWSRHVRAGQDS